MMNSYVGCSYRLPDAAKGYRVSTTPIVHLRRLVTHVCFSMHKGNIAGISLIGDSYYLMVIWLFTLFTP